MKAPPGPKISQDDLKAILDTNPFPFLEQCGREFGKIFTLDLGTFGNREVDANGIWHFVWGREHNQQLAELKYPAVDAGPARLVIGRRTLPGSSLFFNDGDIANTLREIIATNFSGSKQTLITAALSLEESMRELSAKHPQGQETPTAEFLRPIFVNTVFKVMFGSIEELKSDSTLQQLLLASSSAPQSTTASRQQNVRVLNLVKAEIAERKQLFEIEAPPKSPNNHLDTLISLQMHGQAISDDAIADNIATNFYKCRVIFTILNQWAIHWLHLNTNSQQRLNCELAGALSKAVPARLLREGESDSVLSRIARSADSLPYLKAVSQELLRIVPYRVYQSARFVREEISLAGYRIVPGTIIASLEHLTHNDPEVYPEPLKFLPERFLERAPQPFSWTPFGMGERDCPFSGIALSLLSISVAGIQTLFEIEPLTETPLPDNSIGVLPFTQLSANNYIRWKPRVQS